MYRKLAEDEEFMKLCPENRIGTLFHEIPNPRPNFLFNAQLGQKCLIFGFQSMMYAKNILISEKSPLHLFL